MLHRITNQIREKYKIQPINMLSLIRVFALFLENSMLHRIPNQIREKYKIQPINMLYLIRVFAIHSYRFTINNLKKLRQNLASCLMCDNTG